MYYQIGNIRARKNEYHTIIERQKYYDRRRPSPELVKYYQDLASFLDAHQINHHFVRFKKDQMGFRAGINALLTILRKNNLDDEFFAQREGD